MREKARTKIMKITIETHKKTRTLILGENKVKALWSKLNPTGWQNNLTSEVMAFVVECARDYDERDGMGDNAHN